MRIASIVTALIVALVHSPAWSQQAGRNPSPGTTIGVASLVPDELHLRYRAPTAFGHRYHMDEVPEWALDEFTAVATAAILGRLFAYRFEALTVGSVGSTLDPVFVAAEQHGIATVVVVNRRENTRPDFYDGGVGLLVRKGTIGWAKPGTQCAFSWLVFEVWDVASRDRLEKQEAWTCERDERIEILDSYADYSGAEKTQIESMVKTSLLRSVEAAASDMETFRQ